MSSIVYCNGDTQNCFAMQMTVDWFDRSFVWTSALHLVLHHRSVSLSEQIVTYRIFCMNGRLFSKLRTTNHKIWSSLYCWIADGTFCTIWKCSYRKLWINVNIANPNKRVKYKRWFFVSLIKFLLFLNHYTILTWSLAPGSFAASGPSVL